MLETASVYLNRITTDKSDARECLEMLEQARENLGLIESNIEDSIECACVIDAVLNLASQDDHNKPIVHYKMRF